MGGVHFNWHSFNNDNDTKRIRARARQKESVREQSMHKLYAWDFKHLYKYTYIFNQMYDTNDDDEDDNDYGNDDTLQISSFSRLIKDSSTKHYCNGGSDGSGDSNGNDNDGEMGPLNIHLYNVNGQDTRVKRYRISLFRFCRTNRLTLTHARTQSFQLEQKSNINTHTHSHIHL